MRVDCKGRDVAFIDRVPSVFQRFEQIVAGGDNHRRHRKKKRKLERGWTGKTGDLSGRNRTHRARRSGKNRRQNLARPDPNRLEQIHFFHVRHPYSGKSCVDNPHHDAADK